MFNTLTLEILLKLVYFGLLVIVGLKMSLLEQNSEQMINSEKERDKWARQIQSTLTILGYMVSVGNLWRFPYLCLKNGGGT